MTNSKGRKIGGRCRSSIIKTRTSPRRTFADAVEVALRAEARAHSNQQLMTIRPKARVSFTNANGHRVVSVKRQPEVLQLTKARR